MGQYYLVVNLDKKEFLHPHKLGDGLKLMEFAASGDGTRSAGSSLGSASKNDSSGCSRSSSQESASGSKAPDMVSAAADA